jgi:hypothetical protein
MDFLIDLDGAAVNRVDAIVQRATLDGYDVVHRSGACFTAIRQDLLDTAGRDPAWAQWIAALRRLP